MQAALFKRPMHRARSSRGAIAHCPLSRMSRSCWRLLSILSCTPGAGNPLLQRLVCRACGGLFAFQTGQGLTQLSCCSFAAPKGVLGQSYSNPLDLPRSQESTLLEEAVWQQWALPDQNIFSTGQHAGTAQDCITSLQAWNSPTTLSQASSGCSMTALRICRW